MAASWKLAMRLLHVRSLGSHLQGGLNWTNTCTTLRQHRRFALCSQCQARNYDDDPGSKPRKLEFIDVDSYKRTLPKSLFWGDGISINLLLKLQKKYDFRPGSIKNWFWRRRHVHMIKSQSFLPEDWTILGCELAVTHFVISLDGGVLFSNQKKWIRKEKDQEPIIPKTPVPGAYLEAVDLSKTEIMYEGLQHFERLNNVQRLNLSKCRHVDDWFLDKVSGIFRHTLTHLDLTGCPLITERGLTILHRLKYLKSLKLFDLKKVQHGPLVCMMLEEALPQCHIEGIDYWTPNQNTVQAEVKTKEPIPLAK